MLFADKRNLETNLQVSLLKIREKELQFYVQNCIASAPWRSPTRRLTQNPLSPACCRSGHTVCGPRRLRLQRDDPG